MNECMNECAEPTASKCQLLLRVQGLAHFFVQVQGLKWKLKWKLKSKLNIEVAIDVDMDVGTLTPTLKFGQWRGHGHFGIDGHRRLKWTLEWTLDRTLGGITNNEVGTGGDGDWASNYSDKQQHSPQPEDIPGPLDAPKTAPCTPRGSLAPRTQQWRVRGVHRRPLLEQGPG